MANVITVKFEGCTPAPVNGFDLYYKIKGSNSPYRYGGNFTASPAFVETTVDPDASLYEGYIQSNCGGGVYGSPVHFESGVILRPFDYLVLRYIWHGTGNDLDIIAGFINTGVPQVDCSLDELSGQNNNWLGYANNGALPFGSALDDSYAFWALDNTTNDGVEAVLVSFNNLLRDYGAQIGVTDILFNLNAVWWGAFTTGQIEVALETYLGGSMSQTGTNIINTGGTLVDNFSLNAVVNTSNQFHNYVSSQKVALMRYNKINKTAILSPQ